MLPQQRVTFVVGAYFLVIALSQILSRYWATFSVSNTMSTRIGPHFVPHLYKVEVRTRKDILIQVEVQEKIHIQRFW